jgi:Tc5 transposase DNA-binding domain
MSTQPKHVEKLTKTFPSRGAKYPAMERQLLDTIRERRSEGRKVSAMWMKGKAKRIMLEMYPADSFGASRGWLNLFFKKKQPGLSKGNPHQAKVQGIQRTSYKRFSHSSSTFSGNW